MTIEVAAGIDPAKMDPLNVEPAAVTPKWEYIIVHHTGAEEKDTEQIRRYHKSLGWRDIGYHYVIERDGTQVIGRPDKLPGAHCAADGMNTKGIGVALIGNFEIREPYPAQVASLQRLLVDLMVKYSIHKSIKVLGHGSVKGAATSCPGKLFNRRLLKPLRLILNDAVRPTRLRQLDPTYTEMLVNGQWVGARATLEAIGANVWMDHNDNAVRATIW